MPATMPLSCCRARTPRLALPQPAAPALPIAAEVVADGSWPDLWWMGVHGGAGTTTLVASTGLGVDAGRAWPTPPPGEHAHVVLVARASASGLWAASAGIDQYTRGIVPDRSVLVGLAVVAAGPRKPPRLVAERLQVLAGWTPLWRIGWHDAHLAVTDPTELGPAAPDVAALAHAVSTARTLPTSRPRLAAATLERTVPA